MNTSSISRTAVIGVIVAIVVIAAGVYGAIVLFQGEPAQRVVSLSFDRIEADTVVEEDTIIEADREVVVENGASLTIEGDLIVNGTLKCEGGPLRVTASELMEVNGELECLRENAEGSEEGITLVADTLVFDDESSVVANSHLQFVNDASDVARTKEELNALYEETGKNTGEGPRVGPLGKLPDESASLENPTSFQAENPPAHAATEIDLSFSGILMPHEAQARTVLDPAPYMRRCRDDNGSRISGCIELRGNHQVDRPAPDVTKVLISFFAPQINYVNYTLDAFDGDPGSDDIDNSCKAGLASPNMDPEEMKGKKAWRFSSHTDKTVIDNFTLNLGDGGRGGHAVTKRKCFPGIAEGGQGGEPANFKMSARKEFSIRGTFTVKPGKTGDGGKAVAYGGNKKGCEAKGGDADATGGDSLKNEYLIYVFGEVHGTDKVEVDSLVGGDGGNAEAHGGKGGDGSCGCNGGEGGEAVAKGGPGAGATLDMSRARDAGRVAGASETGGDGGAATAEGGEGGAGGDECEECTKAGNGGSGGDAEAGGGAAGVGDDKSGKPGDASSSPGGDGGDGGDGNPAGGGGAGGAGLPPGTPGTAGTETICKVMVPVTIVSIALPSTIEADREITLTPHTQSDVAIKAYEWYVDDALVSTDGDLTHSFPSQGTYVVRLEVTNANGQTDTMTVEIPVTSQEEQEGEDADDEAEPPAEEYEVIEYQSKYLPVEQLVQEQSHPPSSYGEGCEEEHWHAQEDIVTSLDGTQFEDPALNGCGFGVTREYPVQSVEQ